MKNLIKDILAYLKDNEDERDKIFNNLTKNK